MALRNVWLNVTNACNLGCVHCAFSSGKPAPGEMTTSELIGLLDQIKQAGSESIVITGGEPFARRDIWEIIEYAQSLGIRVSLITNGTLLPDVKFDRYLELLKKVDVGASLDGFSPESNDLFRGKPGAFLKTKQFLERCSKEGIQVALNTVLTSLNSKELPAMIRWVVEDLGHFHRILTFEPHGRGELGLFEPPLQETHRFFHEVFFPLYREYAQRYKNPPLTCDLPVALIPPDLDIAHTCSWTQIAGVAADGSIGYCHQCLGQPGFQLGNIREKQFEDAWKEMSESEIKLFPASRLKGICGNCLMAEWCRGRCRASAYMAYQDHFAPDVICQHYYEAGLFPEYAMVDPARDCHMEPPPEDELEIFRNRK